MRRRSLLGTASLLLLVSIPMGCETVPYTGRSQIQLVSPAEEAQMGIQSYQQIVGKATLSTDGPSNVLVQRVGTRIAAVTGLDNKWEFRVIQDDKQANAFALPGGKVAVYTGILPITKDEAGLAAVLGHEIGHVVARHGGERVS
ncbi:MAG TPA: M48 family metallopeptidase, partial [Candidatus Dormibacteraeota bacterium]|nr:M48 family metallopeptidase [Candidatus Dormibacteraeota bacterium]